MKNKRIDKTLQAIGGDSTNVSTGLEGGTIHWVEVKLNRKLNWLVCAMRTNELPSASLDCIIRWKDLVQQQVVR